jgi:hypothetical protein
MTRDESLHMLTKPLSRRRIWERMQCFKREILEKEQSHV